MGITGIRARSIEVLDWARTIHRPASPAGREIAEVAGRLRDPANAFVPAMGPDEERVRTHLKEVIRASDGLVAALGRMPALGVVDVPYAEDIAARARSGWEAFRNVVTFEEVRRTLRGTWNDTDLGDAVRTLGRSMEEHVETLHAGAPAPRGP
jgi:hypothetical protein